MEFKEPPLENEGVQEKTIISLFIKLSAFLPPTIKIISYPQNLLDRKKEELEYWVKPFMNHPDRIAWLESFTNGVELEMTRILPEWLVKLIIEKYNPISSENTEVKNAWGILLAISETGLDLYDNKDNSIIALGRNISDEFFAKYLAYQNEDNKRSKR